MSIRTTGLLAALLAAFSLVSCGGGIGGTGRQMGTLNMSVTDAPACGFDAVNITIDRVRVHASASASPTDSGWSDIVLSPAKQVNLLTLSNGVLESLGQTSLPAGKYTQLRLVLAANDNAHPLANSVIPTGGAETALGTPSAFQTGIKLNADIDVPADKVVDFALDFDACKSIVKSGNSGQYELKPVVSVIPALTDAGLRVVGYVDPAIALGSTNVSVQLNGVPVKASPPDLTGKFTLYPVPAGTYDLVVTAAGRVNAVMTGVPVVSGTPTSVNSASIPITPPAASMRAVDGVISPTSATVRALQAFTGGPSIEAAWGSVDSVSGNFALSLPIGAPVKTAYVASPTSLSFNADAAAASKFTLEAASAGVTKTQAIDVSATVATVAFTFP